MSYDIVAICSETCCITADLSSLNVDSSVAIKSLAFEVARWWSEEDNFSGFYIPKRVDDWWLSAGVNGRDDTNYKNSKYSVTSTLMFDNDLT